MRRRTFRRTATRKTHDYVWVTSVLGTQSVGENAFSNSLVSAGTWEANANNFERATLKRVRGTLDVLPTAAATAATSWAAAIILVDLNFATADFSPLVAGDYDLTDVLWQTSGLLSSGSGGVRAKNEWHEKIDIKAQRKLTSSSQLVFVIEMSTDAGANPTLSYFGIVRSLVDRA